MIIDLVEHLEGQQQNGLNAIKKSAATHKMKLFDPLLAETIARRLIIREFEYDGKKIQKSTRAILTLLVKEVNPKILDIIFHEDSLTSHNLKIPRNEQVVFRIHQDVAGAIRAVIEKAYNGRKIPNRYIRQKTVGCLIHIVNTVNSEKYVRAARS